MPGAVKVAPQIDGPTPRRYASAMDLNEAKAVAEAVQGVDGGCPTCRGDVVVQLNRVLPSWDWPLLVAQARPWSDQEEEIADLRGAIARATLP